MGLVLLDDILNTVLSTCVALPMTTGTNPVDVYRCWRLAQRMLQKESKDSCETAEGRPQMSLAKLEKKGCHL